MTILSDRDIREYRDRREIAIEPFTEAQLSASSYDVRLGPYFCIFDMQTSAVIDPLDPTDHTIAVGPVDEFTLHPNQFALGCTIEYFGFPPTIAGHLDGKSSLGRLGLIVHATAGYFDPGFHGNATLELVNVAPKPIILRAGMLIGQMNFQRMESAATVPYGLRDSSKYDGISSSPRPVPSLYWRNYPDGVVPPLTQPGDDDGSIREADGASRR